MSHQLVYGTVRESERRAIYVLRVRGEILEDWQVDELIDRMRERLLSRGESASDVVLMQGDTKETIRFFGTPFSVSRVRAALFNAQVSWTPIDLD